MLHKTVYLTDLQVICPEHRDIPELGKIAGQLRNAFYDASFSWSEGNLGRVIPVISYPGFYTKYEELRTAFFELCDAEQKVKYKVTLTVIPFPTGSQEVLLKAPDWVSFGVDTRFTLRLTMLEEALLKEKKFYEVLLTGMEEIIEIGLFLNKSVNVQLLTRMKRARREILCYSADLIRTSTSVREEIINICGALL